MAETLTTIIAAVRALLVNVTTTELSDAQVTEAIRRGLKRLDNDEPYVKITAVAGTDAKFFKLTTILTSWNVDLSNIKKIFYPAPVIADDEGVTRLSSKDYEIYNNGTDWYIRFTDAISIGESTIIHYTIPRTLNGLDAATSSLLETNRASALIFVSTALSCYALASKASGFVDSQIPGDFIEFRTKEASYRRMGDTWMKEYLAELGSGAPVKAAIAQADFDPTLQYGGDRLTHYSRNR